MSRLHCAAFKVFPELDILIDPVGSRVSSDLRVAWWGGEVRNHTPGIVIQRTPGSVADVRVASEQETPLALGLEGQRPSTEHLFGGVIDVREGATGSVPWRAISWM